MALTCSIVQVSVVRALCKLQKRRLKAGYACREIFLKGKESKPKSTVGQKHKRENSNEKEQKQCYGICFYLYKQGLMCQMLFFQDLLKVVYFILLITVELTHTAVML